MTENNLQKLREPFPENQISKLPKPTKAQTDEVKADFKKGIRCKVCGGWHHPKVVHLDYVGHAALTDRLLDVDPMWDWDSLAKDEHGLPLIINGGMWITLTVCGMTRKGYGDAQGKDGHNAIKELIGDALRNAGMRFGMALDLWHKGDLHIDDEKEDISSVPYEDDQDDAPSQEELKQEENDNVLRAQLAKQPDKATAKGWMKDNKANFIKMLGGEESPRFKRFFQHCYSTLKSFDEG